MRETRIKIFMQMELEACRNELDWLTKCFLCAANNYPEEYCPPIPLPLLPGYHKKMGNGREGHLATYSNNDDSEKVLFTRYQYVSHQFRHMRRFYVLVIAAVH